MSTIDPQRDPQKQVPAPSRDPHRREALVALELDVTTSDLVQRVEVRLMRRNRNKKIQALEPIPEIAQEDGPIMPQGALMLSFLAGFVSNAHEPEFSAQVLARILHEKRRIDHLLGYSS